MKPEHYAIAIPCLIIASGSLWYFVQKLRRAITTNNDNPIPWYGWFLIPVHAADGKWTVPKPIAIILSIAGVLISFMFLFIVLGLIIADALGKMN
jgi:hypothetical protein